MAGKATCSPPGLEGQSKHKGKPGVFFFSLKRRYEVFVKLEQVVPRGRSSRRVTSCLNYPVHTLQN